MNFIYSYRKCACRKCGRKILVEILLVGTSHNADIIATCAECLKLPLDEKFAGEHPEAAKDITAWVEGAKNE